MEAFLQQRELVIFRDGHYTNTVRELHMELMCMRVGAKNIEKITQ